MRETILNSPAARPPARGTAARAALFVAGLLLLAGGRAPAQGWELKLLTDGILLGVGLPYAGVSEYLVRNSNSDALGAPDIGDVNAFDRLAMYGYSKGLNTAGDMVMYAALLTPASFGFFLGSRDMVTAAVIYVETLAFAAGAKNTFKLLVPRYRPYVYSGGAPGMSSWEDEQSFVSGDSTMAFAAATASVLLFSAYFPRSPWLIPLATGAYGLSLLTATLRVAAGMHFMTDVVAGAVLGTAIGFAVPLLHRVQARGDRLSLSLLPDGLWLAYRY
jgi:membrane-associated phospholipid phosphatase